MNSATKFRNCCLRTLKFRLAGPRGCANSSITSDVSKGKSCDARNMLVESAIHTLHLSEIDARLSSELLSIECPEPSSSCRLKLARSCLLKAKLGIVWVAESGVPDLRQLLMRILLLLFGGVRAPDVLKFPFGSCALSSFDPGSDS